MLVGSFNAGIQCNMNSVNFISYFYNFTILQRLLLFNYMNIFIINLLAAKSIESWQNVLSYYILLDAVVKKLYYILIPSELIGTRPKSRQLPIYVTTIRKLVHVFYTKLSRKQVQFFIMLIIGTLGVRGLIHNNRYMTLCIN